MRLTTLGDLLLDVVVHLEGPLVLGDDRVAVTHTGAGGQAANVAAWAQALGADARLVCKRGADAAGELAVREFSQHGAEVVGPCQGRGGVVVSFAAQGDRTMASDRGASTELRPDELDDSWFDCDVLHLSGYSLVREPIAAAAARAAGAARRHGARVSVDLSASSHVDDGFRERIRAIAPEIVFGNQGESDALGELDATWVVKRGAEGIVVDGLAYPAVGVAAVDPTGAGDALAAGFLVGGPELGLAAAARCCAKLGSMP